MFIIVELVIFPLGCGVTLDICTVALFPQGSLRERLTFLTHAPLTSAFYHWVLGTMFMCVYSYPFVIFGSLTLLPGTNLPCCWPDSELAFAPVRCGSLRTRRIRTSTLSEKYSTAQP